MIVVTTPDVSGRVITETLGLVRGNAVKARAIGRDIAAGLKNIIGGDISEYAELQSQARDQATQRMIAEADALGADAVVTVRYMTSMITSGASEILAYGTAVKLDGSP